ncbi:MAG: hypothetical protein RL272_1281 [Candidatus Parcubacteria bacterium]|jgi:nitrogen fixation NifU-like protein
MDRLHEKLTGDEEMYKENILEHYREPHNAGRLGDATFIHKELNPSCGDTVELFVRLDGDRVADVKFDGHGCAISQAAVSMLTDHIKGMDVGALSKLAKEDVFRLLGVEVGVTRLRCALLGLKTLETGLQEHLKNKT